MRAPRPPAPATVPQLSALEPVAAPPVERVRRLSYSALALFERCPYRFYAERLAGMRPVDGSGRVPGQTGLAATEIGDAVHRLLEGVDLDSAGGAGGRAGSRAGIRARPTRSWSGSTGSSRRTASRHWRSAWHRSRARPPSGHSPSSTTESSSTASSTCFTSSERSRARRRLQVERARRAPNRPRWSSREYRLQRLVYAIACFRAGAEEVEVVYQFLERPEELVSAAFRREELSALEAGAVGGDRAHPGRRVPAAAERVRLRRLSGARRRLRRALRSSPVVARSIRSQRRAADVRAEAGADRADHRAARGRARRRRDRAPLPLRARAARLRDALRTDDGREREPRHRAPVREVPPAARTTSPSRPRSSSATSTRPASTGRRRRRCAGR